VESDILNYKNYILGESLEIIEPMREELEDPKNDDLEIDYVLIKINSPNFDVIFNRKIKNRNKIIKKYKKSNLPFYVALKFVKVSRVDHQFNKLIQPTRGEKTDAQEIEQARVSELVRALLSKGSLSISRFCQDGLNYESYVIAASNTDKDKALKNLEARYKSFEAIYRTYYMETEFLSFDYRNIRKLFSMFLNPNEISKIGAVLNLKIPSLTQDDIVKYQRVLTDDLHQALWNLDSSVVFWSNIFLISKEKLDREREAINSLISQLKSFQEIRFSESAVANVVFSAMANRSTAHVVQEGFSRGTSQNRSYTDVSNIRSFVRNISHGTNVKDWDASDKGVITWERGQIQARTERDINELASQSRSFEKSLDAYQQSHRETLGTEMVDRESVRQQEIFTSENISQFKSEHLDTYENAQIQQIREGSRLEDTFNQKLSIEGTVIDPADARFGSLGSVYADDNGNYQKFMGSLSGIDIAGLVPGEQSQFGTYREVNEIGVQLGGMGTVGYGPVQMQVGGIWTKGIWESIGVGKQELISNQFTDTGFRNNEILNSVEIRSIDSNQMSQIQQQTSLESMAAENLQYQQTLRQNFDEYQNLQITERGTETSDVELMTQQLQQEQQDYSRLNIVKQEFFGKEYGYSDNKSFGMTQQAGGSVGTGIGETHTVNFGSSRGVTSGRSGGVAGGVTISKNISHSFVNQHAIALIEMLERLAMRYQQGRGTDMMMNQLFILADSQADMDAILGVIKGLYKNAEQDIASYREFIYTEPDAIAFILSYMFTQQYIPIQIEDDDKIAYPGELHRVKFGMVLSPQELAVLFTPPVNEKPGIEILRRNYPIFNQNTRKKYFDPKTWIYLGKVMYRNRVTRIDCGFNYLEEIHTLIAGGTGFGKTIAAVREARQLYDKGCKLFIFDPKGGGDYGKLPNLVSDGGKRMYFFSFGRDKNNQLKYGPLMINPLKPVTINGEFIATEKWMDVFIQSFCGAYGLMDRSQATLKDELSHLYGLVEGDNIYNHTCQGDDWPHLSELLERLYRRYGFYKFEVRDNREADHIFGIITRLKYLLHSQGDCFNTDKSIDLEFLYRKEHCPIIEFHDISSNLDKSFIMTFLLKGLYEYYFALKENEKTPGEFIEEDFRCYVFIDEVHKLVSNESESAAQLQKEMLEQFLVAGRSFNLRMVIIAQSPAILYKTMPLVLINCYKHIILRNQTTEDVDVLGGLYAWKDRAVAGVTGLHPEKLEFLRRFCSKAGEFFHRRKKKMLHQALFKSISEEEPFLIEVDAELEALTEPLSREDRAKKTNDYIKKTLGQTHIVQTEFLQSSTSAEFLSRYNPKSRTTLERKYQPSAPVDNITAKETYDFDEETEARHEPLSQERRSWLDVLLAISEGRDSIENIKKSSYCKDVEENTLTNRLANIMEENKEIEDPELKYLTHDVDNDIYHLTHLGHEIVRLELTRREKRQISKDEYYSKRGINWKELKALTQGVSWRIEMINNIKAKIATAKLTLDRENYKYAEELLLEALKDANVVNDTSLTNEIEHLIKTMKTPQTSILEFIISYWSEKTGIEIMFPINVRTQKDEQPINENTIPGITKDILYKYLDSIYKTTAENESDEERRVEMKFPVPYGGKIIKYQFFSQTYRIPVENSPRDDYAVIMVILEPEIPKTFINKILEIFKKFRGQDIFDDEKDTIRELISELKRLKKK